jgi:hypothetical protein
MVKDKTPEKAEELEEPITESVEPEPETIESSSKFTRPEMEPPSAEQQETEHMEILTQAFKETSSISDRTDQVRSISYIFPTTKFCLFGFEDFRHCWSCCGS